MKLSYKTSGVCSRTITADIEDGKIYNLRFEGGCNGNTKGISALVEGMEINDVIDRLKGIKCGFRGTSCPDQLAQALKSIQS